MMQIIRGMDKLKIEFEDEKRLVSTNLVQSFKYELAINTTRHPM